MRRLLFCILFSCLSTQPAWAEPASVADSRHDNGALPDFDESGHAQPWWPSRYGANDQIGTLNEITPQVVAQAASLARSGTVVDMGRILDDDTPKFPGRYWHQSVDTSPYFTNPRRPDAHGLGWGKNEINWITEIQSGTFQVGTQLDSIGHIQAGERTPLDVSTMAALSEEVYGNLVFTSSPACRLFMSPFPVHRIWQANQPDVVDPEEIHLDGGGVWLLVRRRAGVLELQTLTQACYVLLESICRGVRFSDALLTALIIQPDFKVVPFLLQQVKLGNLVGFHVSTA